MSAYRGRSGPNFSEYLNSLNTVSPPYEPGQFGDDMDISSDLAMFTNAEFTNTDQYPPLDEFDFNFDLSTESKSAHGLDFMSGPTSTQPIKQHPAQDAAPFYPNYNTPIQPAPAVTFPTTADNISPIIPGPAQPRKKAEASSPSISAEEKSRLAAEEDKRRRNTAASARFRVKKKQREQALEKTVKEVSDKNSKLEAKLTQLEMENKWLKELITEKHGIQSKEEMAEAFKEFRKTSEERDLKSEEPHVVGVGTD